MAFILGLRRLLLAGGAVALCWNVVVLGDASFLLYCVSVLLLASTVRLALPPFLACEPKFAMLLFLFATLQALVGWNVLTVFLMLYQFHQFPLASPIAVWRLCSPLRPPLLMWSSLLGAFSENIGFLVLFLRLLPLRALGPVVWCVMPLSTRCLWLFVLRLSGQVLPLVPGRRSLCPCLRWRVTGKYAPRNSVLGLR